MDQVISLLRMLPHAAFLKAQAYHHEILDNPEQSRQRCLILTVALTVIGTMSTGVAIKKRLFNVIPFTVLTSYSFIPMVLIHSLNRESTTEIDDILSKDHIKMMQHFLLGIAVIGGIGAAVEMGRLSGFAALYALVAGVATASLWHGDGMYNLYSTNQQSILR